MSIDKSAGKVEDSTEKELETKAEEHKAQAVNDANTVAHDPSKAEDLAKQRAAEAVVEAQALALKQAEMARALALEEAKTAALGAAGDALGAVMPDGGIPGVDTPSAGDLTNSMGNLMDAGAGDLTEAATGKNKLTDIKPSEPSF